MDHVGLAGREEERLSLNLSTVIAAEEHADIALNGRRQSPKRTTSLEEVQCQENEQIVSPSLLRSTERFLAALPHDGAKDGPRLSQRHADFIEPRVLVGLRY